jgi:succinate dehydrogenase/fumarate reductase flavoprotein subunit
MREALSSLEKIEERLGQLAPQTARERLLDCDLRAGALTLKAILQAGIGRKESRGSFLRSDHAGQDDAGWRLNSCLKYDEGSRSFTASYLPVEET